MEAEALRAAVRRVAFVSPISIVAAIYPHAKVERSFTLGVWPLYAGALS